MTKPIYSQYGVGKEYRIKARAPDSKGGNFDFSEAFYESNDPKYDAILLLGATLNHDYSTPNQDIVNYWIWRGFSKKARSISHLFIKEISVNYSIPNFRNLMEAEPDYTGRNSTVGTKDYGLQMPVLSSDGVLAELRTITGYSYLFAEQGSDDTVLDRSWTHQRYSPQRWSYDYLETPLPLAFYLKSIGFDEESKPAWIFWKIEAAVTYA